MLLLLLFFLNAQEVSIERDFIPSMHCSDSAAVRSNCWEGLSLQSIKSSPRESFCVVLLHHQPTEVPAEPPFLLWLKTLSTTTQKRLILIDTLPLSLVCGGNIRVCQMVLNSSFDMCMNITYWRNKPNGQKCNFSQFQFWLIFQIFSLAILANFKK